MTVRSPSELNSAGPGLSPDRRAIVEQPRFLFFLLVPTMTRFVFVHGPWQLIVAASALKQASQSLAGPPQDTLVIYSLPDGPLSQSMVDVMTRIATAVWPWRQVVVLNDAIDWWKLRDVPRCIATLHASLGKQAPDELWAINVPQNPTKITAEAYPAARIVLFEDGLMSYVPYDDHRLSISQCLVKPRVALRALKLRLRERLRPQDLYVSACSFAIGSAHHRQLPLAELGAARFRLPATSIVDSAKDPIREGHDCTRLVSSPRHRPNACEWTAGNSAGPVLFQLRIWHHT